MRLILLALAACSCVGLAGTTALAAASGPPGSIEEFPIETIYRGSMGEITPGPEESLWLTQQSEYSSGTRSSIERIAADGQLTNEYFEEHQVLADIAAGPEGNMWFTGADTQERNFVGRVTPAGKVEEFTAPIHPTGAIEAFLGPLAIAQGADGNMWFTDTHEDPEGKMSIGRVTPSGIVTQFSLSRSLSTPHDPLAIARGSDGNMWFTDDTSNAQGQNFVGRITPAGAITEFPIPTPHSEPASIILGADGDMWFAEPNVSKIGRITATGDVTEFSVAGVSSALNALTLAPDGNIWFTGNYGVDPLGWITPSGFASVLPGTPRYAAPLSLATADHGEIWFTDPRFSAPEMPSTSFVGRLITPLTPTNTASPVLSGEPLENQVLSVSTGLWNHEPTTFTDQWERCDAAGLNCEDILGAGVPTYFLGASDVGHTLRATVTAGTLVGDDSASSNLSPPIQGLPAPPPPAPPKPRQGGPSLLRASVTWRFAWSVRGTVVRSLIAHGLSQGSFGEIACSGRGCAFNRRRWPGARSRPKCRQHRCETRVPAVVRRELDLTRLFGAMSLHPGVRIRVSIAKADWIGRRYVFTIRANRIPSVQIDCLAPGSTVAPRECAE